MRLSHGRAVAMMVLVTLMWSTAGVLTRQLEHARSFEVTFWRSFFTALCLIPLLPAVQGRSVYRNMLGAGRWLWISGVCWSLMFTTFMMALTLTTVANVLVTMAAGPLFTALIARVVLQHRVPRRTWVAIWVAAIGMAWMYGQQFSAGHVGGMWVAACVPLAASVNWVVVQRSHAQGHDVDLVPAVLIGAVLSALMTLPLALPFQASYSDLKILAFMGLVQLAIPCVLAVHCARALKAPELALLALLEVLFGILLAWVGAGEQPDVAVLTGGALVIGAMVYNEVKGWMEQT